MEIAVSEGGGQVWCKISGTMDNPTNGFSYRKTRCIDLCWLLKYEVQVSFVLSQFTHLKDLQTARQTHISFMTVWQIAIWTDRQTSHWFPFSVYSHQRVILHLPAKFCSYRTIGGGVMTSYRFFEMAAYSRKCTSGFRFSDGICLRRWKFICLPNFDEISEFTAEIKLLPVSENGRPPFYSISGFDFDVYIVIGMSFYICLPNFVVNGRSAAGLWRHIDFSRWRS